MNDAKEHTRDALLRWLRWQADMGADEAIAPMPANRLRGPRQDAPAPVSRHVRAAPPPRSAPAPDIASPAAVTRPASPAPAADRPSPRDCHSLEEIRTALDSMRDFPLRRTARHTVHTDGHPRARVMVIGEAPGRDEDLTGKPFVGRAGRLLDLMLAAIGLDRHAEDPDRAVLVSNVLFWRPPGNRPPTQAELSFCAPWLMRTIELVKPRVLVTLGGPATQRLTGNPSGITRQRGKWTQITVPGLNGPVPLLPMLHPAFLLRTPVQKRLAWRDLLSLKLFLEEQS